MVKYSNLLSWLSFALFAVVTQTEVAPCRTDQEYCSCKWSGTDEEICWKQTGIDDQGQFECDETSCTNSGWTCSCEDREYLCPVQPMQKAVFVDDPEDTNLCRNETMLEAEPPVLRLGSFEIGLSRKGMLSNKCNELVLFHNGVFVVNFGSSDNPMITCANADEEIKRRSNYTAVEMQKGDLIAFRFKHASYHCFTSIVKLKINGRYLNSMDDSVVVRYARQHSTNWFSPKFRPVYPYNNMSLENITEATEPSSIFIPLRRKFFSSNETIFYGEDYWHPPDGSRDHALGNFYFRVQL